MCGIAGIISFSDKPVSSEQLISMSETLRHRGPDGDGVWINAEKNVDWCTADLLLLTCRMQLHMPMHYNDRYTIVYNGEIYNYIELRKILKNRATISKHNPTRK